MPGNESGAIINLIIYVLISKITINIVHQAGGLSSINKEFTFQETVPVRTNEQNPGVS
jgi:hypothetical protein